MNQGDLINYSSDEILQNNEVVKLADVLGFNEKTMDTSDVRKRLHAVWEHYQIHGNNEGLIMFAKNMFSNAGDKAGVHPLDVIYSTILGEKLLSQNQEKRIIDAVMVIGGQIYEADTHYNAMQMAKADGKDISKIDKQMDGLFRVSDGRLITRDQAKSEFNISHSGEINNQGKKNAWGF